MNNLRFISSFTTGTLYEKIIKNLESDFQKFNLPYHIFEVPDLGEWKANSRQRPLRIKEAMEMFPGENILWVDADARILKYPEVLFHIPQSCHLGVNYLQYSDHYGRPTDGDKVEILDGTSYYKNDYGIKPFIEEWIERSVIAEKNHRHVLKEMIDEQIDEELNLFLIPREYCYIACKPDGSAPAVPIDNPAIIHYQASRLARKGLKG